MSGRDTYEVEAILRIKDDGSVVLGRVGDKAQEAEKKFGLMERATERVHMSVKNMVVGALAPMATILSGAVIIGGISRLASGFMDMAKSVDTMKVRLKVLLGDVSEANLLFEDLATYAGGVPFELQQVMNSATTLAGIMKGGRTEVMKWMPVIGDLAAAVGLGIEETTEQVMRMLSAGAASADRFRERGVLAMLGFQAGVSYSADKTAEKLWDAWERSDSKFRGATGDLAKTWEGTMSMFADAWFQFNRAIAEAGAWDSMTAAVKDLLTWVNKLKEEGKLDIWAKGVSEAVEEGVENLRAMAKALERIHGWYSAISSLKDKDIMPGAPEVTMRDLGAIELLKRVWESKFDVIDVGKRLGLLFLDAWEEGVKERTGMGVAEYIRSEMADLGWDAGMEFADEFGQALESAKQTLSGKKVVTGESRPPISMGVSRIPRPPKIEEPRREIDFYAEAKKMKFGKEKYAEYSPEMKALYEAREEALKIQADYIKKQMDLEKKHRTAIEKMEEELQDRRIDLMEDSVLKINAEQQKELRELKDRRKEGEMTEAQYNEAVDLINEEYHKKKMERLDKEAQEALEKRISIAEKEMELEKVVGEGKLKAMEKAYRRGIISEKEFLDARIEMVSASYDRQIDLLKEKLAGLGVSEEDEQKRLEIELDIKILEANKGNAIAQVGDMVDYAQRRFDELKRTIEGWGRESADAVVQFAMTGKMSFKDMINSMISDLMRMVIYQQIMQPLFGAVSSFFGSIMPGAKADTGGTWTTLADVEIPHSGGLIPGFARGGGVDDVPAILQAGEFVIRRDSVQKMPMEFWDALNRMHSGGMVSIAGPMAFASGGSVDVDRVEEIPPQQREKDEPIILERRLEKDNSRTITKEKDTTGEAAVHSTDRLIQQNATGGIFYQGRPVSVVPYAVGGVIKKPTLFPMAEGAGLMGEAGPEAVMPLTRIGGDLGVKASPSDVNIAVNVYNNTGAEAKVRQEPARWNGQEWVVSVWLDALERNVGGLRNVVGR